MIRFSQLIKFIKKKNPFRKKLFKEYSLNIIFSDGSNVITDPVSYDTFLIRAKDDLSYEKKKPTMENLQVYLDNLIYLCENFDEALFIRVSIKGREYTFYENDLLYVKFVLVK